MQIKLNLGAGNSQHRSRDVSSQVKINWIPEKQDYPGAVEPFVLVQAPGNKYYEQNLMSGDGPCRGLYRAGNDSLYVVMGSTLWEIKDVSGIVTSYNRGSLSSDTTTVYFADNGIHVGVVDGVNLYLHEMGTEDDLFIQSIPFTGPSHIVYQQSRFFCNATSGTLEEQGNIWYSGITAGGLPDATSWRLRPKSFHTR